MKIAIIVPCYNEEKRLALEPYSFFLRNYPQFHLCFVNDGSQDRTEEILREFTKNHLNSEILNLKTNGGKAEAIRQGMLHLADSSFSSLAYLDADLATPLTELLYFAEVLKSKPEILCVMGSRVGLLGRQVKRKLSRHYLGRVFATFASLTLNLRVYDTQCGAKLLRQEYVKELFQEKFITRWLFDIELIFRIKKIAIPSPAEERFYEFPLTQWHDIAGSKLKLGDFFKAPWELWKIARRYR